MKKRLLILFIFFLFFRVYSLEIILHDSSKTFNTRTDGSSDEVLYFLEDCPLLLNSQKSEILIDNQWITLFDESEDKEILDTYAKYGIVTRSYTDAENKHLYMEIFNYLDDSFYSCFEFYFAQKQLKKKRLPHNDFELKKNSLFPLWEDFPISLLDGSELQFYSKFVSFGEYIPVFQISNNKQSIDILNLTMNYKILGRPCINKKKNKIIYYACNSKDIDKKLFNDCSIFLFSIIYDGIINCNNVVLYAESNTISNKIAILNKDCGKVKIIDQSEVPEIINGEEWHWYQIKTIDDKIGWVYGKYLDIEE